MGKNKSSFTLDPSNYIHGFKEIAKEMPEHGAKGMKFAAGLMIADAIEKEPRAPHDKGIMWRAQTIQDPVPVTDGFEVLAGFNVEYAAAQHEAPDGWNYTMDGSGPKFIESKMLKYAKKYLQAAADYIKRQGR